MKTRKLLSMMLAAAMICTTMLSGCGEDSGAPAEGDTTPKTEESTEAKTEEKKEEAAEANSERAAVQELVITDNSDPLTFDPAMSNTVSDQQCQTLVYEGLTKRVANEDGTMSLVPGVAESWDISEDGLTYTFHIRENAKWADGTPLTAQDFEYSWKRVFTPETGAPQAWLQQEIIVGADAAVKGEGSVDDIAAKAIDDHTFEVKLVAPNNNFLALACHHNMRPVQKKLIDEQGSRYGADISTIVGNGPFIAQSWDVGSSIVYVKNENYWNAENVALTKVTRQLVMESSTRAQALLANELDIAGLNDPDWNEMVDQTGYYNVIEQDKMNEEYLMFNCEKKPFNNWKVRLAISLAFDREALNEQVNYGNTSPAYGLTPSITLVGEKPYAELTGGKNQDIIKRLQAEYPDLKALLSEGLAEEGVDPNPENLTVEFYTRGVGEYSKKSAEWIKQMYKEKLGINININMTEWNVMYDLVESGDYELACMGWNADVCLEPSEFLDLFDPVEGYYAPQQRWTGPEADQYHELVEAYQTMGYDDLQAKADAYLAAEEHLMKYGSAITNYATKSRTLVGKYVHGYEPNPLVISDYSTVWLSER